MILCFSNAVTGASTSAFVLDEDTSFDQRLNVPERSIFGTLGKLRVFGGGEFSLEGVDETVQNLALPFIDRPMVDPIPKLRFAKHT